MSNLVTCAVCSRHIRRTESLCPFCGVEVTASVSGQARRVLPTERLGRAALFTFAAASIGAAGCGGSTDDGSNRSGIRDAGDDGANADGPNGMGGGAMAIYGAPAAGGAVSASGGAPGAGGFNVAPAYGVPAMGGTPNAEGGASGIGGSNVGGFAALYGLPPPER